MSALDTDEQKRRRLSVQVSIDLQFQCGRLNTLIDASVVDQQIHPRVRVSNFFSSSLRAVNPTSVDSKIRRLESSLHCLIRRRQPLCYFRLLYPGPPASAGLAVASPAQSMNLLFEGLWLSQQRGSRSIVEVVSRTQALALG